MPGQARLALIRLPSLYFGTSPCRPGQGKLARLVPHVGIFWGGLDWAALNDTLLKRPAFLSKKETPDPHS